MAAETTTIGADAALTISFRALKRCRTTIEDFAKTYFPLHGLELPQDLFKFLDVLLFVEASIYQMDEDNEALSGQGVLLPRHRFPAAGVLAQVLQQEGLWDDRIEAELESGYRYWEMERRICLAMAGHNMAAAWRDMAQQQKEQQQQQEQQGQPVHPYQQQHWQGDDQQGRDGCHGLPVPHTCQQHQNHLGSQQQQQQQQQHEKPQQQQWEQQQEGRQQEEQGGTASHVDKDQQATAEPPPPAAALDPGFSPAEALATHEAKSFDYRLLHLLVHRLLLRPYDEALLAFMAVDERLVDIGDDLTDYEDDVVANSFNIYRAYLHLYGPHAPLMLAKRISDLEAERERLLAQLPEHQRSLIVARQEAAAEGQGSDKWIFPQPLLGENAFRAREQEAVQPRTD